ncbi:MAG: diaminopimelate decarboxylase [Alphaproteobacteria bacterium]
MDHFQYKEGVYHAEGVSLQAIAEKVGTPFYCYSTATLQRHVLVFASHFGGDAKVCYAVKANSNLAVLRTLAQAGCGADVVSEGEIRLAMAAGIKPQDIVFSGVGKTAEEMRYALEQGIFQFNVESAAELALLNDVAKSMRKKAPVAIRVNPDVDPKTHAKISTGQKESKFGIAMADALALYKEAAGLAAIDVQGVSVHIGSQLTSLEPFGQAFRRLRQFIDELKAAGIAIRTVDLGGGLGIPYGQETPPQPDSYAEVARKEMAGLDCQLMFEPGRMIVGNAGILVSKVLYVKSSATKTFVIVDAGMNDLVRPAMYDAYHEIVPVMASNEAPVPVDVVGPVCETGDLFAEGRKLPPLKASDLVAFRSAGAYGVVMACNYNARLLPAEVMVHGDQFAVVRPRQNYEALLSRDVLPSWLG